MKQICKGDSIYFSGMQLQRLIHDPITTDVKEKLGKTLLYTFVNVYHGAGFVN